MYEYIDKSIHIYLGEIFPLYFPIFWKKVMLKGRTRRTLRERRHGGTWDPVASLTPPGFPSHTSPLFKYVKKKWNYTSVTPTTKNLKKNAF